VSACPVKASARDESLGRITVDYDLCIGCRTCVSVCPFGAMSFDVVDRRVIKCDLCDGDPQCVRFCEVKAVEFLDADRVSASKRKDAAQRFSTAQKKAVALQ
jgi:Fe-S-cluster-containing dehydrogenase component